jgi:hypothetical protein
MKGVDSSEMSAHFYEIARFYSQFCNIDIISTYVFIELIPNLILNDLFTSTIE